MTRAQLYDVVDRRETVARSPAAFEFDRA